jgi:hypothetical protein
MRGFFFFVGVGWYVYIHLSIEGKIIPTGRDRLCGRFCSRWCHAKTIYNITSRKWLAKKLRSYMYIERTGKNSNGRWSPRVNCLTRCRCSSSRWILSLFRVVLLLFIHKIMFDVIHIPILNTDIIYFIRRWYLWRPKGKQLFSTTWELHKSAVVSTA